MAVRVSSPGPEGALRRPLWASHAGFAKEVMRATTS